MPTDTLPEPRIKYPAQQVQLLIACDDDKTAQQHVIHAAESMGFRVQWVAAELLEAEKGARTIFTEESFDQVFEAVRAHANRLIANGDVEFPDGHWPITPPAQWTAEEKRRLVKLAVDWFGFNRDGFCNSDAICNSMRWGQLNI